MRRRNRLMSARIKLTRRRFDKAARSGKLQLSTKANTNVLAIIVGGGPAPGINAVISAAAIEAINEGFRVFGVQDGFKWLMREDSTHARELQISDVSRIHLQGGSFLGTARDNPT